MPSQQIAFIFPPFAHDYPGNLFPDLHGFQTVFSGYLKKASLFTGTDLENFNTISCDFLDDELKTQYIAYILGCTLSDYFDRKGIVAGYSAGYSMGIYTALHHAGAISFETGLDLIRSAYALIRKTIEGDEFLMGSIIGLTREDILQLKHSSEQKSEITIRNSDCSFILSGYASDIRRILEEAKKEGALSVKELRVTVPYHSCFLTEAARLFEQKVHEMKFNETKTPIISLIDQKMLQEESSLKAELIRNIFLPLNWIKTQIHLQQLGVTAFIECGPNKSLVKNSRFLPGNAVFLAANNAEKLMAF